MFNMHGTPRSLAAITEPGAVSDGVMAVVAKALAKRREEHPWEAVGVAKLHVGYM